MHKLHLFNANGEYEIVLVSDDNYESVVEGLYDSGCQIWRDEWVD